MSNAAGRALLVLVAFFLVAGLAWLWLSARERPGERTATTPEAARTEESQRTPHAPAELREPVHAPDAADAAENTRRGELEPFQSARTSRAQFTGPAGSLRGHVEVTGEEPFPTVWRLVARPSRILAGHEYASERSLEFTDGRQDFELTDIPLGGYDVFAEAEGFNGQALPIVLQKGTDQAFVNLRMVPAGTLEGRVLDSQGLGAVGVPITLFTQPDESAREVLTDDNGLFRFEKLPDGAYDLLVGRAGAPLLPERRPVRFAAPHLTFPDIELPLLGEIQLRVVDSLTRPLEGVEVRGSGKKGGVIEGKTDYDGRLTARYLPAGHFTLRLSHPSFDASVSRRIAVEVVAGQVTEAPVHFGP
jgi:hypothetical protein